MQWRWKETDIKELQAIHELTRHVYVLLLSLIGWVGMYTPYLSPPCHIFMNIFSFSAFVYMIFLLGKDSAPCLVCISFTHSVLTR